MPGKLVSTDVIRNGSATCQKSSSQRTWISGGLSVLVYPASPILTNGAKPFALQCRLCETCSALRSSSDLIPTYSENVNRRRKREKFYRDDHTWTPDFRKNRWVLEN